MAKTKRTVTNRPHDIFHDLSNYEACPYHVTIRTGHWVDLGRALYAAKMYDLAYIVDRRIMDGRDQTMTRVVKLDDGTLALAK